MLRLPYVCILSTGQTKINTFTQKDIEVFPKIVVLPTKTQGKKIVVFLARRLGSPETTGQKHPGKVACYLRHRLFGEVGQRCVQALVERGIEVLPLVEP